MKTIFVLIAFLSLRGATLPVGSPADAAVPAGGAALLVPDTTDYVLPAADADAALPQEDVEPLPADDLPEEASAMPPNWGIFPKPIRMCGGHTKKECRQVCESYGLFCPVCNWKENTCVCEDCTTGGIRQVVSK